MRKVTDPALLAELEADAPTSRVTDPALLAELERAPSANLAADESTWGQAGLIGAGRELTRMGQGLQQAYYGLTGDRQALDELAQRVAEEERLYRPLKQQHPIAASIGEGAPSMAMPGATATRMMLAGAIPGLLEYGGAEDRAARGAAGAAGGLLGFGVGKAIGRVNKPFTAVDDPMRAKLVADADAAGIPLSVAQRTGNNALRWIDSALDNLPWTADKQLQQKLGQQQAFNRAVGRTFGANADNFTPRALSDAKNALGDTFTDLASRNRLQFTDQTLNDIAAAKLDLQRYETGDIQRIATNYIDDILNKVEPDGTISGQAYRKWDSAVSRKIRSTNDGDLRTALGSAREIIRNAMDDSISPADQTAWREARRQYANMHMTADTVKGNAAGDVSPAGLLQAVNRQSKNAKFTGGGELGNLARVGKETLQKLPDSGTAQRAYWMRVLGGTGLGLGSLGGLLSPAAALGAAAGAGVPLAVQKAMWGGPGAGYLTNGLLAVSPELANELLRLSSGAGISAARAMQGQ